MKVKKYIIVKYIYFVILVHKNHFEFLYIIGRGGFGKVWKVRLKKTNEFFALKEMSKLKIIDRRSEESIMSERNLLSTLNYSFIVNMYFAFQDFYNLYLVMDLLTGGDLRYHIAQKSTFTELETKFFISNMILALEYIHSNNIIHRDIKPENLVLESNGYLRITDFGVAKINEKDNSSETSGTPGYMAPEVILVLNHSFCSDFFALGVIGYEFMMGYRPYLGSSRKEIKELIIKKQAKLNIDDIPENWSINSMDFINKLLIRKAEKRLGFNGIFELKNHPWMDDVNWENLEMKKIEPPFIPCHKENFDKNYCEGEDDIGEETIERYQVYAQSDLYPDAFKNYTFCNLSYISNYHIKRLKRFKENNIKIKDIIKENVNNALKENKEFSNLKKINIEKENETINIINIKQKKNNSVVNTNNDENINNYNKNKNHSKSVEDFKQYNIDDINKKKKLNLRNNNIKEDSKNESNNNKENNNTNNTNKLLNNDNCNSNYCTIETNKTNSQKKKKSSNQNIKLTKYKNSKEYIKNFKENIENIVYNNYINLHFNNFPNNKNYNNIKLESTLSKKKILNSRYNSNITNKTKSKINNLKNVNSKNKNMFSKSNSMKKLENNKNIFNHALSLNKERFNNDNSKNIKGMGINQIKKRKSRSTSIENRKETKLNKDKNSKKLDYKKIKNLLYNKKFELLLDIINNNVKKININDTKTKVFEKKKYGNKISKSHSSCGFYTNEKILTTQRRKNSNIRLSKKNRNLSMYNISNNNYDIMRNMNFNYKTLNAQCNYLKSKKSNKYDSSKSKSKTKNGKNYLHSKNHNVKEGKNIKNINNKNSYYYKNNPKLIKFMNEHYSINK